MVYLSKFQLREKEDVSFYPYHIYLQKGEDAWCNSLHETDKRTRI